MKEILYTIRKIERYLVAIGLFIMMIIIAYSVFNRFIFKNPLAWNEELSRYVFIWVIMLATNVAIEEAVHVGIEFFRNIFPSKITKLIEIISVVLSLAFTIYMTLSGIQLTTSQANQLSSSMGFSMAYVYSAIPVGFLLMSITFFEILIKMIRNEDLEIYYSNNTGIKFEKSND